MQLEDLQNSYKKKESSKTDDSFKRFKMGLNQRPPD